MSKAKTSKKKIVFSVIFGILAVVIIISGIAIKKHNDYLNSLTAYDVINGPGDFQLEGDQVFILDDFNEIYADSEIGTHISKIIEKYGEPDSKDEGALLSKYIFKLVNNTMFLHVKIDNYTEEIVSRFIFVESSMWRNVKLSTELGTEIEDLVSALENVKEGMTLEEVEEILGDKYLQLGESKSYKDYMWVDINENAATIAISKETGKVYNIEPAFAQR